MYNSIIEVKDVYKNYGDKGYITEVLRGISVDIFKGEVCLILGASGSGKSTLMNIIGGLDNVTSGSVSVNREVITTLNNKKLVTYRRNLIGFVFQSYNLIPNLTVKENIVVGAKLTSNPISLDDLLNVLGLAKHKNKFPSQLSGGQQQRVAIGRALIKKPMILLCDEPTGALDYRTSKEILKLMQDINAEYNTTIVMVTHNEALKEMANRVVRIKDGQIQENIHNDFPVSVDKIEW